MDEMRGGREKTVRASGAREIIKAVNVLWKRWLFIALITASGTLVAAIFTFLQDDVYRSSAIIAPIHGKESISQGLSSMAMQLGSIGMVLPGSTSSSEIVSLLRSLVVREKLIKNYDLLPVLFPELDKAGIAVDRGKNPTIWDGLRKLNSIISINNMVKDNIIIISVDFHNPETAAKITEYLLETLTDHITGEARRVAIQNKRSLEKQIGTVTDPIIRQNVYNLMAQQIEMVMMSEAKENFAFKIIDLPKVPDRKIRPKRRQAVAIGFIASFAIAVLLAYSLEFFRKGLDEQSVFLEEDEHKEDS